MKKSNIFLFLAASAGLIALLGWVASRAPADGNATRTANVGASGAISAEETSYDFGSISMAKGEVTHQFKIKNIGSEPVSLNKLFTSCMCTRATLVLDGERIGPFGMQGHNGIIPRFEKTLAPGKTAEIEAVFDPAAHGPAGVGAIERTISLENSAGAPLQLGFRAVVTP